MIAAIMKEPLWRTGVVLVGSDLFFHDASVHILGATLQLDAPGLDYAATARRAPA